MVTAVLPSNQDGDRLTLELGPRFDWQGQAGVEAVLLIDKVSGHIFLSDYQL